MTHTHTAGNEHIVVTQLPEVGFLRLDQIIGQVAITEKQARDNREHNKQARDQAIADKRLDAKGNPVFFNRPVKPRQAVAGIIPVSKSTWWNGVKHGRFPKPVKLSPRTTVWHVEDIRTLIAKA